MKTKMVENGTIEGTLKTALEYSPDELNQLLPSLGNFRMANDDELISLRSDAFKQRFNQGTRYNAKLRGRSGDTAAIWVYPEVKVQSIIMLEAAEVDETGLIRSFSEHQVHFPLPALLHFIGIRTE